jgi:DNA modification methylase
MTNEPSRLAITYRLLSDLRANPSNTRTHPKSQIAKLQRIIAAAGFTNPILIDRQDMILCGHGRALAADALGMREVPTILIDGLSEADVRALVIADNAISDKAGCDKKLLRTELKYLAEIGYDVELTGFDSLEIDTLLSVDEEHSVGEAAEEEAIEPSVEAPVSRVGDLWHCSRERMIVGDSRDPLVVERLMGGKRAQLAFLDPPYGCLIVNNVSGLGKTVHDNFLMGAGQESLPELAMTILRPAFKNVAAHCQAGAIAFVCSDRHAAVHMLDAAKGVFEEVKNWIVWVKTNAGMGSFYRSQFELIFAFKVSPGKVINNFGLGTGGRHRSNVWTYAGVNTFRNGRMEELTSHPTVKPRKLVMDAILDCSKRGGIVLDVFAGSGTTLSAARAVGRIGYGVELDPKYADVILHRLHRESGVEPLLDRVTPFSTVAADRRSDR